MVTLYLKYPSGANPENTTPGYRVRFSVFGLKTHIKPLFFESYNLVGNFKFLSTDYADFRRY